jgi:hypothetical protein
LAEVFTPSADELAWALARTTSEHHRVALLVLLLCYRRLGFFPRLGVVPAGVIDHVRQAAGLGMSVAACHDSERTLWRHREWIRTRLGVVYEPARVRAVAEAAMLSKDNPADVINVALEALANNQCELPGYTTLDGAVNLVADKGFPGQPWVRMGGCGAVVRRLLGSVR